MARRRVGISILLTTALVGGMPLLAQPAGAAPGQPSPAPGAPSPIAALPAVDAGPDGHVPVPRVPSPALKPITPLPPVDPGPDATVAVDRAPVVLDPPSLPSALVLPLRPGQELVDATAAEAFGTLAAARRLAPGGTPDLDANTLQPQVASAPLVDPTRRATVQELLDATLSGNIPPPLPVDPLALLQRLPDGLPRVTYRLCSESATKTVSCTLTLPVGVPAILDVTGDRTPDVLADLVPAVSPDAVLTAASQVLSLEQAIRDVQSRLDVLDVQLSNPLRVLLNPGLLLESLRLKALLSSLQDELRRKVDALVSAVNLGLGLLALRLPTSETTGRALPAHVWAVYDLPGHKRLSIGVDGLRRGATLPQGTLGVFTFNPGRAAQGVYDVRGALRQDGAGDALAITAGLASVAQTAQGQAVEPTVASIRFSSPVPAVFDGHALIDQAFQKGQVDATTDRPTHLDALVLTNRASGNRFTQLKIDTLPSAVAATLVRRPDGSATTLDYQASSVVDQLLFADYEYVGSRLDRAVRGGARSIPTRFGAATTDAGGKVTMDYVASSRLEALDVALYDRRQSMVLRGELRRLPTALSLLVDQPARHVDLHGDQPIGSAGLLVSKNLGAFAPLDGDHATLVTDDATAGVSARVSGLRSVDAFFDGHPRVEAAFDPGGQPFVAAGQVDGTQKARVDVTNLPSTLSVDVDPVARTVAWRASSPISRVQAAYVDTARGPSLVAAVNELPTEVDIAYDLGDRPHVDYRASSVVPRVELFASPQGVETLDPNGHDYLSVAATSVPTAADLLVDFPARHLAGTMSGPLGAVVAVARFPVGGRAFVAAAELTGVPAQFDADFADGLYRFRGLSGPLASARLVVTNHAGNLVEPTGQHLAVHFREATGDFDASAYLRNLSTLEYARTPAGQTFRLEADAAGEPVVLDVDVVLAAGGVDDTRLAATGRVTNLPATFDVALADGVVTYRADRSVGLEIEARIGKVAALAGLGAPLFANGVAVVGRGCDPGGGCATDQSPYCTVFSRCFGAVATLRMAGLPTLITVDTAAGTASFTGYQPPAAPLQAYLRLTGLLGSLPDVRVLATLSGLPSPLDLTVGPISFTPGAPSRFDVGYRASSPLGSLRVDADATTTDATFPVLRTRATIPQLPAVLHATGQIGGVTRVALDDSAPLDSLALVVTGASTGYLDAALTGIPAQADVTVDFPGRHAEATMSSALGGVRALAHIPSGNRTLSAFVDVRDVPGRFDADFGDGTYRFRGLSGALGHAALAVTNHGAATALAGPHVAVHHRQRTGDFDASASLDGLRLAEFSRGATGQAFGLDMGAARVGLDADVVLARNGADDTRLAATGFLDTPNSLRIELAGQKLTYRADRSVALQLEATIGKVAALAGLGAPLFSQGVAIHARGCNGGPGCADDGSPFCTLFGPCFGAVGTVNLPGLPSAVEADLATRTFSLGGYRPIGEPLRAFVQLDGLLNQIGRLRALARIDGLPSPLDLTVGPFTFDTGDTTKLDVRYTASSPLGSIRVDADADTSTSAGNVRGRIAASGLPARLRVTGQFGSVSHLGVDNSGPIGSLSAQVTALLDGGPASGLVSFGHVPARMDLDISGFAGSELGLPTITYNGHGSSTLDGLVQVEADLIEGVSVGGVNIPISGDAWARVTNLGSDTRVIINDDKSVLLTSNPGTTALALGATVESSVPNQELNLPVFDELGFEGTLTGHVGAPTIHIGGLTLSIDGLRSLSLLPGDVTYLTTGIRGDYDHLAIDIADVFIDPDVELTLEVDGPGPANFDIEASIQAPFTGVRFHLSDNQMRRSGCFGIPVAHLNINTRPSQIRQGVNHIDVFGADGDQALNYIDPVPFPGGLDPALVSIGIDLLTVYVTKPLPNPEADFDPGFGGC